MQNVYSNESFLLMYVKKNIFRWALVLLLQFVFLIIITRDIHVFSQDVQQPIHPWIFPLLFTNPIIQSFFMLCGIVLFCDYGEQYRAYCKLKNIDNSYIKAMIIFGILGLAYVSFYLLLSIAVLLPSLQIKLSWGSVLATLGRTEAQNYYMTLWRIPREVLRDYSPLQASLLMFMLQWVCLVSLGLILNLFNLLYENKSVGTILCMGLLLLDFLVMNELPSGVFYYSPVSLPRITLLRDYAFETIPLSLYSFLYYFAMNIVTLFIVKILSFLKSICKTSPQMRPIQK